MIGGSKTTASDGSTAIGGNNEAPIFNVNADRGAKVDIRVEHQIALKLPSFLGQLIVIFSQEEFFQYEPSVPKPIPPDIQFKLDHNNLPSSHQALEDFLLYGHILLKAYHGVEQQKANARLLVKRRATLAYNNQINTAHRQGKFSPQKRVEFVRENAGALVDGVIEQLLQEYISTHETLVEQEIAHLAVSLIVADAIMECGVLERPKNAFTP